MSSDHVVLRLERHEALVLFEWLAWIESHGKATFQHPAEEKVLWNIEGQLESSLHEPFLPDYATLVDEARRLVDSDA